MDKRPELIVENGTLAGKRFELPAGGVMALGRSSTNDIHVPDEKLSRKHCLFEAIGETGIRVTDLASANGTIVNGKLIGGEPIMLKLGDVIEVGDTRIRVGGEVDLGLGKREAEAPTPGEEKTAKKSRIWNLLMFVLVIVGGAAIYLILNAPREENVSTPKDVVVKEPVVTAIEYERVQADSSSIFRYYLTLEKGVLTVKVDDTSENRHPKPKSRSLTEEAVAEINEFLAYRKLRKLDDTYVGLEPDPPALDSWELKVVYDKGEKSIKVVNTAEPEAFQTIREKLEAFSKSELGIWAVQYSRAKLVELATKAVELGDVKWQDRDVDFGNLAAAIAAYNEAIQHMETIDPRPGCYEMAVNGLKRATEELDKRFKDRRFQADRALNLSQWEEAIKELHILMEMVPDRRDDRNRDVRNKLLSAESKLKKGGAK